MRVSEKVRVRVRVRSVRVRVTQGECAKSAKSVNAGERE
jgi:hypothetical protein